MSTQVLVADDSGFMRTIIVDVLRELGMEDIVQAADGREALHAFAEGNFGLMVLDWEMPHKSGIDVLKSVRAGGHDVPIVMVTGVGTKKEHVIEAMQAGATDYMLKPFDPSALRKKLVKFCQAETPEAVPA